MPGEMFRERSEASLGLVLEDDEAQLVHAASLATQRVLLRILRISS